MKKVIVSLLLCSGLSYSVIAQDLFRVIEKDQDGKWNDGSGNAKNDYINNRIADINSTLMIEILSDNVVLSTDNGKSSLPKVVFNKITALKEVLMNQGKILDEIDTIVRKLNYSDYAANPQAFNNEIAELQKAAQIVNDIGKIDSRIEDLADSLSKGTDDMYSSNYTAAAQVLKMLEGELAGYARQNDVAIKFGAWLIRKNEKVALHLPGFDNISPQEQYEVERWAVMLTAAQRQELLDLQKYARENRDKGINVLKQIANYKLNALKGIVLTEYQTITDQITTEINNLGNNANVQGIVNQAKTLRADIKNFIDNAKSRIDYYGGLSTASEGEINNLLARITDDITYFTITSPKLKADAEALKLSISASAATLPASIKATMDNIAAILGRKAESIKKLADTAIKDILEGKKLDEAALQFSDAVLKLSLDEAQKSFEYDLLNSGYREDGNRIAFKLSVYSRGSDKPVKEQVREIYLFKVLPHIISTVGIVFADPFRPTAIQTQFQMAPYYNLLFKGVLDRKKRRRSISYNRIFDWGVGLHVSAPDFDKDDVPELGLGVVVSALHDYLQSGIAYNIFTGDPYWFVGIRIPMPSFGANNNP